MMRRGGSGRLDMSFVTLLNLGIPVVDEEKTSRVESESIESMNDRGEVIELRKDGWNVVG